MRRSGIFGLLISAWVFCLLSTAASGTETPRVSPGVGIRARRPTLLRVRSGRPICPYCRKGGRYFATLKVRRQQPTGR